MNNPYNRDFTFHDIEQLIKDLYDNPPKKKSFDMPATYLLSLRDKEFIEYIQRIKKNNNGNNAEIVFIGGSEVFKKIEERCKKLGIEL